jgi:hypothetical protein|tara:strand:+ start:15321 stop:16238 length:918 start_codon:yes stop_codon:yes gene_type:complete
MIKLNFKALLKLFSNQKKSHKNIDDDLNNGIEQLLNPEIQTQSLDTNEDVNQLLITASKIAKSFESINPAVKPLDIRQLQPIKDKPINFIDAIKTISQTKFQSNQLVLSISVILILISSSTFGLHHSGKNALPGENLYQIKTFEENISLMTKRNNLEKAKKHLEISASTVQQMKQLINKNNFEETEIALQKIQQNLTAAGKIYNKQINFDHMQIYTTSRYQLASTNSINNKELIELQNYIYSSLEKDTWEINTILNSSCKDLYKIIEDEIPDEKNSYRILCKTMLSYQAFLLSLKNTSHNSSNIN